MHRRLARGWHLATAAVGVVALVVQLVLVITGVSVLDADTAPGLGTRLVRFFGYFTIQSNLLAAVVAVSLAVRPDADGRVWRVARVDAVVAMSVTGLVHWFLLRPLLHLQGLAWATDKLLHVVAPLLVVLGWLLFGPRRRVGPAVLGLALVWPVVWLVVTLLQAQVSDWYPYPFLDLGARGAAAVSLTCVAITVLFLLLEGLVWLGDRRLPGAGSRPDTAAAPTAAPGSMTTRGERTDRVG